MVGQLVFVALGGALGSVIRALVGAGVGFPFGTLTVNVLGSAVIGVAFALGLGDRPYGPFLMIGVLGGFTTFSTFSLDTLKLVQGGQASFAALYVCASLALSLGAVWLGYSAAERLS